jgi:phage baseplate assembly protein W
MASLNFNNFRNVFKEERNFTYNDLYLDLEQEIILLNDNRDAPSGKDLRMSLDEHAIKNSIVNIFNTTPGERFLIPEFGINLRRFLFEPVSDGVARTIGDTILYGLERWEPRIRVDKVNIMALNAGYSARNTSNFSEKVGRIISKPVAEDEYVVNVMISIPLLRHRLNLEGFLTREGFEVL